MEHGTLIFLDIEGSRDPEILQVGCVAITVRSFAQRGASHAEFSSNAAPVGGLTPTLQNSLQFLGLDYATACRSPPLAEVAAKLRDFVEGQRANGPVYLVAHDGSTFDFPLLKVGFQRAGVRIGNVGTFDSLKIFEQLCPDERCGLEALYTRFFGTQPPGHHNALADAKALLRCCQQFEARFRATMPAFQKRDLD